jgi:hypothetical protein
MTQALDRESLASQITAALIAGTFGLAEIAAGAEPPRIAEPTTVLSHSSQVFSAEAVPARPSLMLAQAGTIGGTIAKENRSVTGGEVLPQPPRAAPELKRAKLAPTPAVGRLNLCSKIAGVWTAPGWWNSLYGRGDAAAASLGR